MHKKKQLLIKRACIMFLTISILCHTFNKVKLVKKPPEINPEYNGTNYFASYSNGKVYICTVKNKPKVSLEPNDILVLDKRNNEDPDMQIISSYSIYDAFTMGEIINILLAYEEMDPSSWERTFSSMENEWICHNISYLCNYETARTADADLNNGDEEIFKDITLKKMIEYRENYVDE